MIRAQFIHFTYNIIQISLHPVFIASYDFAPEVDHYDAIVLFLHRNHHAEGKEGEHLSKNCYQFPEDIVVGVSPVIARRPGRRVREYDWRPRVPQSIQHRLLGDVRDVHHHSQPVHLQDDSLMDCSNTSNQPYILYFQLDLQLIPFQSH